MNNSDTPASPIEFRSPNISGGEDIGQWRGLTKRETFAMAAMQGILSSAPGAYDESVSLRCRVSVEYADALLKELTEE